MTPHLNPKGKHMTDDQLIRKLAFLAATNPVGPTEPDYWKQALDRLDSNTYEKLCTEYGEDVSLKDTASNVVELAVREIRTRKAPDQTTVPENRMAAQIPIVEEAALVHPLHSIPADAHAQEAVGVIQLNVLCLGDDAELELFSRIDGDVVFARAKGLETTPSGSDQCLDVIINDRKLVFEPVADEAGIYQLLDMTVGQYDAFMMQCEGG